MIPVLPVSQAQDGLTIKPSITVISHNEFLIVSWTGASSLGLFVTGEGEPVRGTLMWPAHPDSICESPLSSPICQDRSVHVFVSGK